MLPKQCDGMVQSGREWSQAGQQVHRQFNCQLLKLRLLRGEPYTAAGEATATPSGRLVVRKSWSKEQHDAMMKKHRCEESLETGWWEARFIGEADRIEIPFLIPGFFAYFTTSRPSLAAWTSSA